MNRTVPTLLGVVIILLVALLVIAIFNLKLYGQLAGDGRVVGTQLHKGLTGEAAPVTIEEPSATSPQTGLELPLDPNRPTASKARRAQHPAAASRPSEPAPGK